MNKIVILGDGLLGKELHKQTGWPIISRSKNNIDFCRIETWSPLLLQYTTIINCIAYTNVQDVEKTQHWDVNYKALTRLVDWCNDHDKKLIHISTDYVYINSKQFCSENDVPVHGDNWYSYTKLLADAYIELKSKNYLICRGTHKPNPFPFKQAWINQIGNFDYVNKIADLIIQLIEKDADGIVNVGTDVKSIYVLARQTKPNIEGALKPSSTPSDTTMNLDKMYYFGCY